MPSIGKINIGSLGNFILLEKNILVLNSIDKMNNASINTAPHIYLLEV